MTYLRQPASRQPADVGDMQRQLTANVVRLQLQVEALANQQMSFMPLMSAMRVWLAVLSMSAHHIMPYHILIHDLELSERLLAELQDWRIATKRITTYAN